MDERHATDTDRPETDEPTGRDEPPADSSLTTGEPTDVAVLYALDSVHTMPIGELCGIVDADAATVDHCCHRLRNAGYVRARSEGAYSITARGERYLRLLLKHRPVPS